MAKTILLDEFHLTVFAPHGLRETAYNTIRATLDGACFRADFRRSVRDVVRGYPSLRKVRVTLTR